MKRELIVCLVMLYVLIALVMTLPLALFRTSWKLAGEARDLISELIEQDLKRGKR